jgi:membrane-associated phospholipid phosphatase
MMLYYLRVPMQFFVYAFSGLVLTVITAIITLYWKISYHTAIITSVVTAVNILGGIIFWPLFLLIPIVSWARVTIKKHTLSQVTGGAIISFIVTSAIYYLFGFQLLK